MGFLRGERHWISSAGDYYCFHLAEPISFIANIYSFSSQIFLAVEPDIFETVILRTQGLSPRSYIRLPHTTRRLLGYLGHDGVVCRILGSQRPRYGQIGNAAARCHAPSVTFHTSQCCREFVCDSSCCQDLLNTPNQVFFEHCANHRRQTITSDGKRTGFGKESQWTSPRKQESKSKKIVCCRIRSKTNLDALCKDGEGTMEISQVSDSF